MNLVDDKLEVALTYIEAVERAGAELSVEAFDSFATLPRPVPVRRRESYMAAMQDEADHDYFYEPGETPSAFLLRSRWIDAASGSVRLTALGRSVLAHARRPALEKQPAEPMTVIIDPRDPLAYIRIFDLLASAGPGTLVDPYLHFQGLYDLRDLSQVNRVLTSDWTDRKGLRLQQLARALGAGAMTVEVRILPTAKLHDRFYIPDVGPVFLLGSSLNSITTRPGVVAPIEDVAAATAIRSAYQNLWTAASTLEPRAADDAEGPAEG